MIQLLLYQKTAQNNRRDCQLGLADDFRTLRWEKVFEYPEVVLRQMKELCGRC